MEFYTYFLFFFYAIVLGHELSKDGSRGAFVTIISFLMYLPLFGRILGWW